MSIGYIIINILKPQEIIEISSRPILSPGETGLFDDSGVSLACITYVNKQRYLYYLGWNLGVTVPFRNTIGLAIENLNTQQFEKYSRTPILDRINCDPFSLSYPSILWDNGKWRMWYGSHLSWGKDPIMQHVIKYAESEDGITWRREGHIALNLKSNDEYALSRPCVLKDAGLYKMWYCYRGKNYRIGYAESFDGLHWQRKDEEVGIDVSPAGWDSEMIAYPFVFDHHGKRYLLYNGNAYGQTGFGLAEQILL